MDGNGERVDMMKVLVTGADGMLGRDVMRALREKHVNARGVDMAAMVSSIFVTSSPISSGLPRVVRGSLAV